jgi:hypothetical protein
MRPRGIAGTLLTLAVLVAAFVAGSTSIAAAQVQDRRQDLTIARHTDIVYANGTADGRLATGTTALRVKDRASDVACCVVLSRSGNVGTFGVAGDGLDVVTSQAELTQVMAIATHRVKVVTSMNGNMCGTNGGLLGCANQPGTSMALTVNAAGGTCATKLCWSEKTTGFKYKDKDLTPDGMLQILLKEGLTAGKAKIIVKGKGVNLDMPNLTALTSPVTMQIRNVGTGECWGAQYSFPPVIRHDAVIFKDKAD